VKTLFRPAETMAGHGWVVCRDESHCILFLAEGDAWTPEPVAARAFGQQHVAERTQRRVWGAGDAWVMPAASVRWLRPPLVTVGPGLVRR
jgi:hypothetical protein